MNYQFEKLLLKEKIQETDLSTKLKKMIADLRKLETAIPAAEERLKTGSLSVKKKEELETQIADSKAAIPDMDNDIVEGIKKWIPNREKNAEQGRRLAEARANKMGTAAPAAAAPAASHPAPAASTAPVKQTKAAAAVVVKEEEKKGMSGWGWFWTGLGVVALTLVGIQGYKAYKESKAA